MEYSDKLEASVLKYFYFFYISSIPGSGSDGNFSLRHLVQTGSGAHPAS
jgi:hypothetical protein